MELERIIEILEKHQEWRRDKNVPPKTEMQNPIEIGTAIDYALSKLKKLRLGDVSKSFFCVTQRGCLTQCDDCALTEINSIEN